MILFYAPAIVINKDQKITEELAKKIINYNNNFENLSIYLNSINYGFLYNTILNSKFDEEDDDNVKLFDLICTLYHEIKSFDHFCLSDENKSTMRAKLSIFIADLKSENGKDELESFRDFISITKKMYEDHSMYNLSILPSLFKRKSLSEMDYLNTSKVMFLSNDYFNIEAIYSLRSYILKSKYSTIIKPYILTVNPQKDIISIFLSDYMILDFILSKLFSLNFNKDIVIDKDNFLKICIYIYCRYILWIYILITDKAIIGYLNESQVPLILSRLYNMINYKLFTELAFSFSFQEKLYILLSTFYDDICLHVNSTLNTYLFDKTVKLFASLSRSGRISEEEKVLIKSICKDIFIKWKGGDQSNHVEMIKKIIVDKKYKSYKNYFSDRSFIRNLREIIKDLCIREGLEDKICGYHPPQTEDDIIAIIYRQVYQDYEYGNKFELQTYMNIIKQNNRYKKYFSNDEFVRKLEETISEIPNKKNKEYQTILKVCKDALDMWNENPDITIEQILRRIKRKNKYPEFMAEKYFREKIRFELNKCHPTDSAKN